MSALVSKIVRSMTGIQQAARHAAAHSSHADEANTFCWPRYTPISLNTSFAILKLSTPAGTPQ